MLMLYSYALIYGLCCDVLRCVRVVYCVVCCVALCLVPCAVCCVDDLLYGVLCCAAMCCVVLCAVFRSVASRYVALCDDVDCSVSLVHVVLCGSVMCYDCSVPSLLVFCVTLHCVAARHCCDIF